MSWTRSKLWRRIEDAVTGRLVERDRKALFDEVRENPQARADYDLAFEVMRALEQAPVAQPELDVVETWLMADLQGQPEARMAWWRRPWMAAVLAVAAAALLVVGMPSDPVDDDGFQARGAAYARHLAIDVLCPQRSGATTRDGIVPAAEHGCGLDGTLSFAYRVDPAGTGGVLSLFGVDAMGEVLYYTPTPADPVGVDAGPGTWTPLPMVVRIDVNHEPGTVVVYGLVSPEVPTVPQIDAMAAALAELGPSGIADAPWHERLADHPSVAVLCGEVAGCESAELTFTIHEAPR